MKQLLLIILVQCLSGVLYAQDKGCVDSISLNRFNTGNLRIDVSLPEENFLYEPQRDAADNLYLSGASSTGTFSYWHIFKFDVDNKLVWDKGYKSGNISEFRNGGKLHAIQDNGDLIFSTLTRSAINPFSYGYITTKADKDGKHLWTRKITRTPNPDVTGVMYKPVPGNDGPIYYAGIFADLPDMPVILTLDNAGNIAWAKSYRNTNFSKYHTVSLPMVVSMNSTVLVMANRFFYNADIISDPNAKLGIQLVKIDRTTGAVLQQKAIMHYSDPQGTIYKLTGLLKLNYDRVDKQFLLCTQASGYEYSFTTVDDEFNILKTASFSCNITEIYVNSKVTVDKRNQASIISSAQYPKQLYYTNLDASLQKIAEKRIELSVLGFPANNYQTDLAYKKNGILNFQLSTITIPPNSLFIFDHSPFYNNVSPCLGKDSSVFKPQPIYAFPVNDPPLTVAGDVGFSLYSTTPDYPVEEFPLVKLEVCKTVSLCDTIKLYGNKTHCMSDPFASFKIDKNKLCIRKTAWQVDANAIKIIKATDTTLDVQFLHSYRGKLYVGFGGCELKDSIDLEVYDIKGPVTLGKDTMDCPGKTILLHAGTGYRSYHWQDNRTTESYPVTQPGRYHVTVIDSCGNISRDTIIVAASNAVLRINYPETLCKYDTVTFVLPLNLYNYTWQPGTDASLSNYHWQLYPNTTTQYSISGERFPGCVLNDTVLIKVADCPIYIYFPTAFTPNNDGRNDTYHPYVAGRMVFYDFAIYNRWGQQVFKSSIPNQGWNGRIKQAQPTISSYVWVCRYQFVNGPIVSRKGMFTLVE